MICFTLLTNNTISRIHDPPPELTAVWHDARRTLSLFPTLKARIHSQYIPTVHSPLVCLFAPLLLVAAMSDFPSSSAGGGDDYLDVPDPIRGFYRSLSRHLATRNIFQLHQLYENDFPQLSERYYPDSSWPHPDEMARAMEDDEGAALSGGSGKGVQLLYRDLYYRHIYSKLTVDIDDRIDSFHAYTELFHTMLQMDQHSLIAHAQQQQQKSGKGKKGDRDRERSAVPLSTGDAVLFELPVNWLWDLLDEFVYQFESFHLYRARVSKLTEEEMAVLNEQQDAWNGHTVLRYLHAMVRKAGISVSSGQHSSSEGVAPFFFNLGVFALVALLRVHVLLCDYSGALSALQPLDLRAQKALLSSVPSCFLTLYYYLGYAYLLLHRYVDSMRVLSYLTQFRQRNKHMQHRIAQSQSMQTRMDRVQAVLVLASALHPDQLDDAIQQEIKDKFGEKQLRLQRFDRLTFEELFFQCAPKCLTLTPAASQLYQPPSELRQQQWAVWWTDVAERSRLPALVSYLRLFSSVSIGKLASQLSLNEPDTLALLLMYGQKSEEERWTAGGVAQGGRVAVLDTEMKLDGERVEMEKSHSQRRYGDFFVRQIVRLEEIQKALADPAL